MDFKIWALVAVTVFIGGFASFTGYFSKLDSAQHAYAEAKAELEELEKELGEGDESEAPGESDADKLKQLVAVYEGLEAKKRALSDEIAELEGRKTSGLKVFRDVVDDARAGSVGMPSADVPYRNGQILKEVRIQKVTDTELTLAHSEGVAKLRADELPPDLKDRFRLGMEPYISMAKIEALNPAPATAAKSAPNSKATTASTYPSVSAVEAIQQSIAANEEKITSTRAIWVTWANRVTSLRFQASNAKAAGRPTYTLNQQAAEAEKQAHDLDQQLTQLRAEDERLRRKLTQARKDAVQARSSGSQR
ncbi:hypothetical protein DES53_102905 [Roseimicrobium gellanilyticum]|uniref:Uncharacterized protein n=1 Tax=Roseimicrobium gellanilyticum TaxID=748857 RepID=A0A366HUC8_9BACT|nr:hypothetical protein [Roseimicrobium gellanilyticum]RBP46514.1 hypothetical protein DES53_102905 [Roseimicrobium gellanilyticum]